MSDQFELTTSPLTDSTTRIDIDITDPIAFLNATPDDRHRWLRNLGLGRYAPLLAHLTHTPANITGVARFITHPDRVKFPDLRGMDLSGLDLAGVNLIRAQLHHASLRGATLRDADLIFANFSYADLTDANLSGATLNQTTWNATIVNGCDLRFAKGLTVALSHQLVANGAIVD